MKIKAFAWLGMLVINNVISFRVSAWPQTVFNLPVILTIFVFRSFRIVYSSNSILIIGDRTTFRQTLLFVGDFI